MLNELVLFNSQDLEYKTPFGATPCNKEVTLNIRTHKTLNVKFINLHLITDTKYNESETIDIIPLKSIKEENLHSLWSVTFSTPETPKLLFYYFEIIGDKRFFYGNNKLSLGGKGEVYFNSPKFYQITTYYEGHEVPSWFKKSIAYQIFPDRFFNSKPCMNNPKKNSFIYGDWNDIPYYIKDKNNHIQRWDFFGGDLKGIEEKISYLKSLNISLIYLNPIFKAASNHRYDTGDYHEIDPLLGTEEDFISLVKACKDNGINVILDGVFNHTGKDSIYFNYYKHYENLGAYNSKDSPFYSWYRFKEYPDKYESWWGIEDLPCVNELNPNFLDFIIEGEKSVLNQWFSCGISGWRLDVADELPSYFIEKFKYKCKELNEDSIVIGEVWEDASNKLSYNQRREYFNGLQLDSVMNYPLRDSLLKFLQGEIPSETLALHMNSLKENYPEENYNSLFNLLSSHDVERVKTMIKNHILDKETLEKALKYLTLVQFTLPGVPVIYYGDEVGVEGGKDPDNRRTYPWGKENINLLEWYKKVTDFRNRNPILSSGETYFHTFKEDVFSHIRYDKESGNLALILWNRNRKKTQNFSINLKDLLPAGSKYIASDIYQWDAPLNIPLDFSTDFPVKIPPLEAVVFISETAQKTE